MVKKKKKDKWLCPLCLGYDHPPSSKKLEKYEAMERLWEAIDTIFSIMYYDKDENNY